MSLQSPFGAAKKVKSPHGSHRDYVFPDGYVLRQYKDGAILVLKSPNRDAGTELTPQSNRPAWEEASNRISALKAENFDKGLKTSGKIAETALTAWTRATANTAPRRGGPRRAPAAEPSYAPAPSPVPWGLIGVAGGALLVVVALARG